MSYPRPKYAHPSKDKLKVLARAKRDGRKILWLDDKGFWHAATNLYNTPNDAVEIEEVK